MKFWLSGEVQSDIGDVYMTAARDVEAALNMHISSQDYGPVETWGFIAIIRPDDSPIYHEVKRFHSRDRSMEFRLKIDHGEFLRTDARGARQLILLALLRSLQEAQGVAPWDVALRRLGEDLLAVARAHDWIRQN